MTDEIKNIKPCVGVMVFKDGKILVGKRKATASHGAGEYSFPGGRMEFDESFEECIVRETLEESGIEIKNIKFQCVANINKYEIFQVILIVFIADWESGEPKSFENEKIGDWNWCDLDNLPSPLFYPTKVIIDSYKTGKNFYDKE